MDAKTGRLGLAVLVCAAILATVTTAAASGCKSQLEGEPCLGPLNTSYSYAGLGGGDLGYLSAKLGPQKAIGWKFMREPEPRQYRIKQRLASWHSRPGVTIVAVFVVESINGGRGLRYRRVSTGPHSGHTTLTAVEDATPPMLVLQGRRDAHASAASTPCYVREVPCLGRVQLLYAFGGKRGGASGAIHITAGPTELSGSAPDGKPIQQRSVSWKSVPGVQLVAAFVLRAVTSGGKGHWRIQRVPTGPHGGVATLSTEPDNPFPEPLLLVEGRRT